MRNWIKIVTDKDFPPPHKSVLLVCENQYNDNKYRTICKGFYIPKFTILAEDIWNVDSRDCEEYNEQDDCVYAKEGWYEEIENWDDLANVFIYSKVTHWQNLPKLPDKE